MDANSKEPLHYANVMLLEELDSTYIKGVITDKEGCFNMELPQLGQYLIRVSFMGYESKILKVYQNNLDTILLLPDAQLLKAAEVTTTAKIFKIENGGISSNVQNSYLKNLGTADNVLAQLPLVTQNGDNFTVFGKGTPLIYINNRLVRDVTELQELNASDIKKVTVITDPGAEYDATVQSVIKIETIRPQGEGLSGTITGNFYVDRKISHSEIVNLNYRKKNLDIFGMVRFSQTKEKDYTSLEQSTNFNEAILTKLDVVENEYKINLRSNLGFNYLFGKNNSFGAKYEVTFSPFYKGDVDSEMDVFRSEQFVETFSSNWKIQDRKNPHYINSYLYLGQFKWISVKLDMDFLIGNNSGSQDVYNYYENVTENIKTNSSQKNNLYAAKLIMATPIKKGQLSYGGEYAFTLNRQNFNVNEEGETQNLSSNNNTAKQNLAASFVSFNYPFGSFSTDVGLRYEYTDFKYFVNDIKQDEQSKIYHNLFPSAGVSYNNEKHSIAVSLNYRNTITRPSYYQLRNSIQYDSPYSYEAGNPFLKPMITNSLTSMFMWKDITLMVNFDMYKNTFLFIPNQYSDETVWIRPVNFDKSQNLTAAISYSPTFFKMWNPILQVGVSKNFLVYNDTKYNNPQFYFNISNTLVLHKNWQIGADISYMTSGHSFINYEHVFFTMDCYISKSFFKNKLRLKLQGNDIFNTNKWKNEIMINNIAIIIHKNSNTQGIHFSVTYRFNSTQNKYMGESATEEKNRL